MIEVGCFVKHLLSGLFFRCENKKQERWMRENPFYIRVEKSDIPLGYFDKKFKQKTKPGLDTGEK